jgi:hypothetical protein
VTAVPHRLGALVLAAMLVAACSLPRLGEAEARAAAAGFVARSAPLGASMERIQVSATRLETRDGRPGWVVEIEGTPLRQGETEGVTYYYILFVDGASGEVTILGQG